MPSDSLVPNPATGGDGGEPFSVPPNNSRGDGNVTVTKLEVWHGENYDGWHILLGLRLTFSDDTTSHTHGRADAGRVDRLFLKTDKGQRFEAGGKGGVHHQLDIGSGFLQGFDGAAASDIHRLRPRFLKFHSKSPSSIAENEAVGGKGGQPFWSCHADIPLRVLRLTVAHGNDIGNHGWNIIRAVQIEWEDKTLTRWYGNPWDNNPKTESITFDLDKNEVVEEMKIWGNEEIGRAEGLQLKTSLDNVFEVGGKEGTTPELKLGNGVLVGFEGAGQGDIDRLAPIFLSK